MPDDIDKLVTEVMNEMGVEPNKPARWKVHIHNCIDQSTGEVYRKMEDGYVCSKCGKHSCSKKSICDGCGSTMQIEKEREKSG